MLYLQRRAYYHWLDNCLEGGETTCITGTVSGYLTPGTFQQYCLSQASNVTLIPDGIDLAGAAPLMCGGVSVYSALKRAHVRHGQWVLISGAGGGLGHLAIQYAKAMGARIISLDVAAKERLCLELGSDIFIDFAGFATDGALAKEIHKLTGGGAKVVLVCSSSHRAYAQALSFLGFRGILACLGVPEGDSSPIAGANVPDMITNELTIFGKPIYSRSHGMQAAEGRLTYIYHDYCSF